MNHIKCLKGQFSFLQNQQHSEVNAERINQTILQLNYWKKVEADFWQQKSGDRWIKETDNNTRYFHSLANKRRVGNHISALRNDQGQWFHNHKDLESLLINHFSKIAQTSSPNFQCNFFDIVNPIITQE